MALKGVKVLEFAGLAPAPFCGKILSDFGASVTRIDKLPNNPLDVFQNGKRTIAINIKHLESQNLIKTLCSNYDVLLEPYRPGIMEKYNLGPDILLKENPKLIYARLTGFGQTGPLAARAGHDINYVAVSGILSLLGRKNENPTPPINLLADFAGGGLLCAFGICLALLERHKSGKGQIVDNSMVEGAAYVSSWLFQSQKLPIWGQPKGENILDSGAFYYDSYRTKDGKYMSVGALEIQFFNQLIHGLELDHLSISQYSNIEESRKLIEDKFLTKTQSEWTEIFEKIDACVFPVVEMEDAWKFEHNKQRKSFIVAKDGTIIPQPAPRLNRTPGQIKGVNDNLEDNAYKNALDILKEIGKSEREILKLATDGIIILPNCKGKL